MSRDRTRLVLVAGARPNFMKIAPMVRAICERPDAFDWKLVHTGQHYDQEMSGVFFEELGIPKPHFFLECGGGSHAVQTAKIMTAFESVCDCEKPQMVIVVGDVNSTMACSIVAKKLQIEVAHIEAGLRSNDRSMPEEINRLVTDSISDLFFVTEPSGEINLIKEGHDKNRIHFVGHVMIDNLFFQLNKLLEGKINFRTESLKGNSSKYFVATLHRPSNVDSKERLEDIMHSFAELARYAPVIFSIHPRTAQNLQNFRIAVPAGVISTPPLPYMEFLNLWKDSAAVLTDSGGLQEESTALGVPCITLRENTERPITVDEGTNALVGHDPVKILEAGRYALGRDRKSHFSRPKYWDGEAAKRIVNILDGYFRARH